MSTKNIARTAIEGGRTGSYKTNIKVMNRRDRHKAKALSRKMIFDIELAEEQFFTESPYFFWDDIHDDKLNPVWEWLYSKVGMSWNDVYSEMRRRFDFRTIPGLHIVGHILNYVDLSPKRSISKYESFGLYIDDENIIRFRPYKVKTKYYRGPSLKDCYKWADGRKIRDHRGILWWYGTKKREISLRVCTHHEERWGFTYRHRECPYAQEQKKTVFGKEIYCIQPISSEFKKLRKLTKKEQKFWESISEEYGKKFVYHPYEVGR